LKNEVGYNGFNHASFGLLSGKRFFYLMKRSRYKELISDFQQKHTLPAPYLLHCNMGYIGSPLMTYFLYDLKKNKKIFFLNRNDNVYSFAHEGQNLKKINNLNHYIIHFY
jgi:hypothetical protein